MFFNMCKKKNSQKESSVKNAISLLAIGKLFKVNPSRLMFAIAETFDGDSLFDKQPVVLVIGTDEYIDLTDGGMKKNAFARNSRQNFFDCQVTFDKEREVFVFKSPKIETEIKASTLQEIFGVNVLTHI